MTRGRVALDAVSRPADVHETADPWTPAVRSWRDTAPAEGEPIVCRLERAMNDRHVLLLAPVHVSTRGALERFGPGETIRVASWQADALVRDGYAQPA